MNESTTRVSRRSFLLAVGGAVTAGAAVAKGVPAVEHPRGHDDERATRGYQASQHVHDYYRTVRM